MTAKHWMPALGIGIGLTCFVALTPDSAEPASKAANKQNEITNWLAWFAGIAIEAHDAPLHTPSFLSTRQSSLTA